MKYFIEKYQSMGFVFLFLLLVFFIIGCSSQEPEKTLKCVDTYSDTSYEYVYGRSKLIYYYFNGELIEDGSIVEGERFSYRELINNYGGVESHIETMKSVLQMGGFACTVTNHD